MAEPQKKKRINLPKDFDSTDRARAAELLVTKIIERTNKNIDAEGKRFKNYSSSYANSLDFKIAGKSQNDPNLQLSGDMLNSIQLIESASGYITLGFNEGTPENDKAVWAERSDNGPVRKFLDVRPNELAQVIAAVRIERPRALASLAKDELATKTAASVTSQITNSILKNLGIDTSEN